MNVADNIIQWIQEEGHIIHKTKNTPGKQLYIELLLQEETSEAVGELLDQLMEVKEELGITGATTFPLFKNNQTFIGITIHFSDKTIEYLPFEAHTESFENDKEIVFNEKLSKKYNREITNSNNMKGIEEEYITESGDRLLIERIDDKLESIAWFRNLTVRTTIKKMKNNEKKRYSSFFLRFPKPLLDYMGAKEDIYLYEHFEKICVSATEPPKEVPYKKISLTLNVGKKTSVYEKALESYDRVITVPQAYWEMDDSSTFKITLYNKPDYLCSDNKLILMDSVDREDSVLVMKNEEITELLNTLP